MNGDFLVPIDLYSIYVVGCFGTIVNWIQIARLSPPSLILPVVSAMKVY